MGPEAKWTHTPAGPERVHRASSSPTARGTSARSACAGGFDLDTRGHRLAGTVGDQFRSDGKPAASGRAAQGRGLLLPRGLGRRRRFGGVDGQLRGYLVGKRAMLAARVGGRQLWGEYPWFEAAFIGGSRNLRGYRKNRFGGDASLYGSLEARLWLFRGRLIAPGRWGVFGLDGRRPRVPGGRVVGRVARRPTAAGSSSRCTRSTRSSTRPSPTATTGPASTSTMASRSRSAASRSRRRAGSRRGAGPLALSALLTLPTNGAAQDTHYWSIQYGPVGPARRAGSSSAASPTSRRPSTTRAPSRCATSRRTCSRRSRCSGSSSPPRRRPDVSVLDTSSSRFGAAPSLLAGVLPRWLGEDTRLAWSFLTRQKLDVRLGQRLTDPLAGARRPQRGRVLLRPARRRGLGGAHAVAAALGVPGHRARRGTGSTAARGRGTS